MKEDIFFYIKIMNYLSVLVSNSDFLDGTAALEEVTDVFFTTVETEISDEDSGGSGVSFILGTSASGSKVGVLTTGSVTLGLSLFNEEGSTIVVFTVEGNSLLDGFFILESDESNTDRSAILLEHVDSFDSSAITLEEFLQFLFSSSEGEVLNDNFVLSLLGGLVFKITTISGLNFSLFFFFFFLIVFLGNNLLVGRSNGLLVVGNRSVIRIFIIFIFDDGSFLGGGSLLGLLGLSVFRIIGFFFNGSALLDRDGGILSLDSTLLG